MSTEVSEVSDFRVGSVLSRGFSILFRNMVPFMLLAAIVFSPLVVYTMMIDLSFSNPDLMETVQIWTVVVIAAAIPLNMLLIAALAYGTFQDLRGQRATIGECLSHGLGRIFPVLGVTILSIICVLAGLVLLIVPGLIVATMLWVAVPVAVVEKPGVIASLKRSAELTSGYRWPVFGILFLLNALDRISGVIMENIYFGDLMLYFILSIAIMMIIAAFEAVVVAVGYHDLRVAKEGIDTDQIAAVFD